MLFIAFKFGLTRPDSQRFTVEKATPILSAKSCCVRNERCLIFLFLQENSYASPFRSSLINIALLYQINMIFLIPGPSRHFLERFLSFTRIPPHKSPLEVIKKKQEKFPLKMLQANTIKNKKDIIKSANHPLTTDLAL